MLSGLPHEFGWRDPRAWRAVRQLELVWQAAQHADASALVRAWLAGEALPVPRPRRMRL